MDDRHMSVSHWKVWSQVNHDRGKELSDRQVGVKYSDRASDAIYV